MPYDIQYEVSPKAILVFLHFSHLHFIVIMNPHTILLAQNSRRWNRQSTPIDMVDSLAGQVNKDHIQDTALNDASRIHGSLPAEYRLANTLDDIRMQIAPYLQWMMYIGLSLAVILIIYNGFTMVTNVVAGSGEISAVRKRLTNIAIGVIILTGFYSIIRLMLAAITYLLG